MFHIFIMSLEHVYASPLKFYEESIRISAVYLVKNRMSSENNIFITITTLILLSYHEQQRSMSWLPFLPNELSRCSFHNLLCKSHLFVTSTQAAHTELSVPNTHSHCPPLHKIKPLQFTKYSPVTAIQYLECPDCHRHMAYLL